METENTTATRDSDKCCFRSCKVKGAQKLPCSSADCNKLVHLMCYQGLLLNKHKLSPLANGGVACTKKCHEKAVKELSGGGDDQEGGRKGNWDSDGLNGPDDKNTSMKILLDWWMTEGNYAKFCGKHNDGIKKKEFCASLAQKMSEETSSKRDAKNVLSKIQHLEKRWREAYDFATSETGAGIAESDGQARFEDIVKRKCPYYYDLLDVMADRASSAPKVTSYEDDAEDVDDDISEDESSVVLVESPPSAAASSAAGASTLGRKRGNEQGSSAKKKRKSNKNSTLGSLMDDSMVDVLQSTSRAAEERVLELARHNKAMEEIETKKMKWKGKNNELEYKMNLLAKYGDLKKYGWNDEQIVRFYPDMKQVIDADDGSENTSSSSSD